MHSSVYHAHARVCPLGCFRLLLKSHKKSAIADSSFLSLLFLATFSLSMPTQPPANRRRLLFFCYVCSLQTPVISSSTQGKQQLPSLLSSLSKSPSLLPSLLPSRSLLSPFPFTASMGCNWGGVSTLFIALGAIAVGASYKGMPASLNIAGLQEATLDLSGLFGSTEICLYLPGLGYSSCYE